MNTLTKKVTMARSKGKHSDSVLNERRPVEPVKATALPGVLASDLKEEKIDWLWECRLAFGHVVMLEGRKATGKTSIAAAIASDITGGVQLGVGKRRKPAGVVWAAGEESARALTMPKLRAAGADLSHVIMVGIEKTGRRTRRIQLPGDLDKLAFTIKEMGARLVVLDPLSSAVHPGYDLRNEQQARAVLDPLSDLANEYQCIVLVLRHLRKGEGGPAVDQGLGGVALGNSARIILRADAHPDVSSRCILSCVATNLGKRPGSLEYEFETCDNSVRIKWLGDSPLDADTLAEGLGDMGQRDARGDARRLLFRRLENEWALAVEVMSEAKGAGISESTLRAAKAELHVRSKRMTTTGAAHWEWGPPINGWPEGLSEN